MSDILLLIAAILLVTCTFVVLIYWLSNILKRRSFSSASFRTEEAFGSFSNLDTIIETCVGSVNNKMVSDMKRSRSFLQSDKEEALNECKKLVSSMANQDSVEYIRSLGLDPDAWINARIEYFVRKQKSVK